MMEINGQFWPAYQELAKNTELTLVSSSNNYYQLNKEGIYKLGNLKTPVNNSLLSSYIKYLWSSFLHKDHVDLEKERLEYIQTVGGVCCFYLHQDM